jgi:hypothetical protein
MTQECYCDLQSLLVAFLGLRVFTHLLQANENWTFFSAVTETPYCTEQIIPRHLSAIIKLRTNRVHEPPVETQYSRRVGSEFLTSVVMKRSIFWYVTPGSPMKVNRRFERINHLDFQQETSVKKDPRLLPASR